MQYVTKGVEPIRGSTILLVMQILFVMFIIDTFYSLLMYFLFQVDMLKNLHYALIGLLFIGHFLKNILEISFVVKHILNWANKVYYISDQHVTIKEGIFNIREKIYDLKIMRSVSVNQGWIGKLLRYGDITITTSASGGYNDEIDLVGISHPENYKGLFKHCLEVVE